MEIKCQNVALIVSFCKWELWMDTLLCYEAHVQHIFPNEQTKEQSHPQPSDPSSRGYQHVSHSLICPDQSNIRKPPPCWSGWCWHPFNCADWPWGRGALIHPTVSAWPRILATHGTLPHLLLIHFITLHSYLQSCCDLDTVTPSRVQTILFSSGTRDNWE